MMYQKMLLLYLVQAVYLGYLCFVEKAGYMGLKKVLFSPISDYRVYTGLNSRIRKITRHHNVYIGTKNKNHHNQLVNNLGNYVTNKQSGRRQG